MKNSIILSALVVFAFTTSNATTTSKSQDLEQQEFTIVSFASQQSQSAFENTAAESIFKPESVIESVYVKTMDEVIAENKLITESKEESVRPLSIATTIEDRIAEDNQIIESTVSNEMYPLDFEKINRSVKGITAKNNAVITVDLKL
ncbi:hypothetical protein [Flavobacterium sp.]